MALQKLQFKPGINKEITRYADGAGWEDCDKIRFRQGFPEKIGGWSRISTNTYIGVARSLHGWVALGSTVFLGVGTNEKLYIEKGGAYNDITPLRDTQSLTNPIATTSGSSIITVTDATGGYEVDDYVTLSGSAAVGGIDATDINKEHKILTTGATFFTVDTGSSASSTVAAGGGTVSAAYQISPGPAITSVLNGWGASTWGGSLFGVGGSGTERLREWSLTNFGEDLLAGIVGGSLYYWDATSGLSSRAVLVSSLGGASNVPTVQNGVLVSDISRFVFCFGANPLGSASQDPMLIRWSDQEDVTQWTPSSSTQAGSLTLSNGSKIITARQARQEILVWTDAALYSLQFVGYESGVWGAQLVGENISVAAKNATAYAGNTAYWMGKDKFYRYDGRVQPLRCDVQRHVFNNLNEDQFEQVFAGTIEEFDEVWWFYCSSGSTTIDRYVVYNYVQDIWYVGSLARTAWLETGLLDKPRAATYNNNLVSHEVGVDDLETATTTAISASITSGQFDIDGGDKFMFVWRVLPDITFSGSTNNTPVATLTFSPFSSSGSGPNNPLSEGGSSSGTVTRTASVPVEEFTEQINTRFRGRQASVKIESTAQGVIWQLGIPRIDSRPDGRR